jgi:hypothetical protein
MLPPRFDLIDGDLDFAQRQLFRRLSSAEQARKQTLPAGMVPFGGVGDLAEKVCELARGMRGRNLGVV